MFKAFRALQLRWTSDKDIAPAIPELIVDNEVTLSEKEKGGRLAPRVTSMTLTLTPTTSRQGCTRGSAEDRDHGDRMDEEGAVRRLHLLTPSLSEPTQGPHH